MKNFIGLSEVSPTSFFLQKANRFLFFNLLKFYLNFGFFYCLFSVFEVKFRSRLRFLGGGCRCLLAVGRSGGLLITLGLLLFSLGHQIRPLFGCRKIFLSFLATRIRFLFGCVFGWVVWRGGDEGLLRRYGIGRSWRTGVGPCCECCKLGWSSDLGDGTWGNSSFGWCSFPGKFVIYLFKYLLIIYSHTCL